MSSFKEMALETFKGFSQPLPSRFFGLEPKVLLYFNKLKHVCHLLENLLKISSDTFSLNSTDIKFLGHQFESSLKYDQLNKRRGFWHYLNNYGAQLLVS